MEHGITAAAAAAAAAAAEVAVAETTAEAGQSPSFVCFGQVLTYFWALHCCTPKIFDSEKRQLQKHRGSSATAAVATAAAVAASPIVTAGQPPSLGLKAKRTRLCYCTVHTKDIASKHGSSTRARTRTNTSTRTSTRARTSNGSGCGSRHDNSCSKTPCPLVSRYS